jgi:hypothetical protein
VTGQFQDVKQFIKVPNEGGALSLIFASPFFSLRFPHPLHGAGLALNAMPSSITDHDVKRMFRFASLAQFSRDTNF